MHTYSHCCPRVRTLPLCGGAIGVGWWCAPPPPSPQAPKPGVRLSRMIPFRLGHGILWWLDGFCLRLLSLNGLFAAKLCGSLACVLLILEFVLPDIDCKSLSCWLMSRLLSTGTVAMAYWSSLQPPPHGAICGLFRAHEVSTPGPPARNAMGHSWLVTPYLCCFVTLSTSDLQGPPLFPTEYLRGGNHTYHPCGGGNWCMVVQGDMP